jgi:hypothetical protein
MKSSLEDLFTITCGRCRLTNPFLNWCRDMPDNTFCCPECAFTFRRQPKANRKYNEPFIELVEVRDGE